MFRYTADGLAALEGGAAGAAGAAAGAAGPGAGGADGAAAGTGGEGAGGVGVGSRPRNHYLYELKGIVVHSGTAFAGHYYSFIKERPRLGEDGQVGHWAVRSGVPCGRSSSMCNAPAPAVHTIPNNAGLPSCTCTGRKHTGTEDQDT